MAFELDEWSAWFAIPVAPSMRTTLPTLMESGLYRLRRAGGAETDYIGQTGLPLVRRWRTASRLSGGLGGRRIHHVS